MNVYDFKQIEGQHSNGLKLVFNIVFYVIRSKQRNMKYGAIRLIGNTWKSSHNACMAVEMIGIQGPFLNFSTSWLNSTLSNSYICFWSASCPSWMLWQYIVSADIDLRSWISEYKIWYLLLKQLAQVTKWSEKLYGGRYLAHFTTLQTRKLYSIMILWIYRYK